ncbi:hypothetical protein Q0N30_19380 [Priestia megaterium]|uniref:hypothetical protein n=1 Tax=Priestia megaterium TaxID=1404 RepID=UPI00345760ED
MSIYTVRKVATEVVEYYIEESGKKAHGLHRHYDYSKHSTQLQFQMTDRWLLKQRPNK